MRRLNSRAPWRPRGSGSGCGWKSLMETAISGGPRSLVLALLGLPLRDGHRRVAHLGALAVGDEVDVLEPLAVVALGEVGAELRPARLLALDRRHDGALGHVEQ